MALLGSCWGDSHRHTLTGLGILNPYSGTTLRGDSGLALKDYEQIPGDSSSLLLSAVGVALTALGVDFPLASACPGPLDNVPSIRFSRSSFYPINNHRREVESPY